MREKLSKMSTVSACKVAMGIAMANVVLCNKTISMEENIDEETKLVNEDWLKEKKNNNSSLVLKLFLKKNDSEFSSVDETININIKNENGKDIICNADEVENFLSLNEKKWALFEIKNKNENENKKKYLYCSDIDSPFKENVGDYGMFQKIEDIEEVNVVVCDSINVKRTSAMFALCKNLVSLNLKKLNTQNVEDMRNMFGFCNKLKNVFLFENVTKVVNMAYLFNNCYLLETINGLKEWNTKNVCVVSNMFNGCRNLKKIENLEKWDLSNVEDLSYMFANCQKLEEIVGIEKWNAPYINNVEKMFYNCENLKSLNLSWVNVEKIDKCDETFGKCKKLTNLIFKTDFENKKQELLNKFQIENPGICCFLG